MKKVIIFPSSLLTLIWATPLLAQPLPVVREKRSPCILDRFDKNGDGQVSQEENAAFKRARERHRQRILKRFERDGDGKLSQDEWAEMREAREKQQHQILEKYDQDGDGHLPEEEKAAAKEQIQKRRQDMRERFKRYTLDSVTSSTLPHMDSFNRCETETYVDFFSRI